MSSSINSQQIKIPQKLLRQFSENEEQLYQSRAKHNYCFYLEYTHNGKYVPARYHRVMAKACEAVVEGKIKRLMVNIPPQRGKSITISESLPSYFLGKYPEKRVIAVSYGDTLAHRFGRRNKEKVLTYGKDIFGIQINPNKTSDKDWEIKGTHGGMLSSSIGSQITGSGADLMIIDDPYKNRKEANSKRIRDVVWQEWKNTLKTRLSADARVIIISTRWHEDDICGRLMEQSPVKWKRLRIPEEAEENDPLGRKPGEPLWPEAGFDREKVLAEKTSQPSYVWSALYQQRPTSTEGNIFHDRYFKYFVEQEKHFRLIEDNSRTLVSKESCVWFQTIDTALKDKEQHAFTVIATWAYTLNGNLLLYNIYRKKLQVPYQWPTIKSLRNRYGRYLAFQAVEDKASGTGILQTARKEGKPLKKLKAANDKIERAFNIVTFYENRMVYHKRDAEWLNDYEQEVLSFPHGTYADQVDVASYAAKLVADGKVRKWKNHRSRRKRGFAAKM